MTAILVWMVQRSNLLESVRPELFLDGWSRSTDAGADTDIVTFRSIQNVGRGAAFNVILNCLHPSDRPTAVMSTKVVSIVPLGAPKEVDCKIQLYWRWVKGSLGLISIPIEISYSDSRGRRFVTMHRLAASQTIPMFGAEEVAPGVVTTERYTKVLSLKRTKLASALRRCINKVRLQ